MHTRAVVPPQLRHEALRIEKIARGAGLDPGVVAFEMVDARDVNALAAYGGFPVRYPSWRFGMDFERLDKGRQYGLSRIYELVINTDPAYAWLVRTNSDMEQKLVMAHVYGHADFFRHNVWFQPTDKGMLDRMADHGTRVRRAIDLHGQDAVESFLDAALVLDNLLDPFLPLREHMKHRGQGAREAPEAAGASFEAVRARAAAAASCRPPTFDLLGFLAEHAPVAEWQRELLRIVRAEAYYFLPQRMTKIMNEGWASFWHSRILTGGVLDASEIVEFADCHSGATASSPGQLNPYKLGIEMFRTAEERGLDVFRLRRVHNDASFVDEIVDEEFVTRHALFLFGKNGRTGRTEVETREFRAVKERLLQDLSWGGLPRIELVDDDREGRGELVLRHHHDGRDLQFAHAAETLKSLARLWGSAVHLETREEGNVRWLSSDGAELRSGDRPYEREHATS
ncbi:MAG: SpoVR family protein [Planctomycetes bacterium]|nr:SpoVR family protein [Planctomycetota bacterium]